MRSEELFVMVLLCGMASGVFIIVLAMRQRSQRLEMVHRERMSMIERGLVPPPEMLSAATASGPRPDLFVVRERHQRAMSRKSLSLGIVVMAVGFGFMSIVGIAAETPAVAIGIGGAIVIVGAAFIVISQLAQQSKDLSIQAIAPSTAAADAPPHDPLV